MIKIKDNVYLKELEKFGYLDMGNCYQKYDNWGTRIYVDKKTRIIERFHPYSTIKTPSQDDIQDLIQADLVEKVSD